MLYTSSLPHPLFQDTNRALNQHRKCRASTTGSAILQNGSKKDNFSVLIVFGTVSRVQNNLGTGRLRYHRCYVAKWVPKLQIISFLNQCNVYTLWLTNRSEEHKIETKTLIYYWFYLYSITTNPLCRQMSANWCWHRQNSSSQRSHLYTVVDRFLNPKRKTPVDFSLYNQTFSSLNYLKHSFAN